MKEFLNDIAVGVAGLTTQISSSEGNQISHSINEKLRVGDAVFLFQFGEEPFSGASGSVPRKSCMEYDFRSRPPRALIPCLS